MQPPPTGLPSPRLVFAVTLLLTACTERPVTAPITEPGTPVAARPSAPVATQSRAGYAPGTILVSFAPGADGAAMAAAAGVSNLRPLIPGVSIGRVPESQELTIAAALSSNPNVLFAEPDWRRLFDDELCAHCDRPGDDMLDWQWNMHNDGELDLGLGLVFQTGVVDADVDWLEAYDALGSATGGPVKIGILDTGIRASHVDFGCKDVTWRDFYTPASPTPFDDHGHGSHVSGIAGGCAGTGQQGIVGVAWGANMDFVVGKVCQADGSCLSSAIATAITWAVDSGANVINMSFGDTQPSQTEATALQYATGRGVLPVCAAGNDGTRAVLYPAADPNCVAVSATNFSDGPASYSSYGPEVELSAPGGDLEDLFLGTSMITSAWAGWDTDYVATAGTSMAAPHVTGLAALLYALGVTDLGDLRTCLRTTADDLGPAGWDERFGWGRINVFRAVQGAAACVGAGGGGDPGGGGGNTPPTAAFTHTVTGLQADFTDTSTDPDGTIGEWSWDFGDGVGTSTAQNPTYTYGSAGTFDVTLTVTDDGGASSQTTNPVTVSETPPPTATVHVGDLDGVVEAGKGKNRWRAVLTVEVHDEGHAPLAGATVAVFWSGATSGTGTVTTGPDGRGSISTGNTRGDGTVLFGVSGVTVFGHAYDGSANHDPDGDSDGSVLEVGPTSGASSSGRSSS